MALTQINLPNSFIDSLDNVSRKLDTYTEDTLKAGAGVLEPIMGRQAQSKYRQRTVRESESTGQLTVTLGVFSVKARADGKHDIKLGFAEIRADSRSNALIANVLEYGSIRQASRPFLAPTRIRTRKTVIEAMKRTLTTRLAQDTNRDPYTTTASTPANPSHQGWVGLRGRCLDSITPNHLPRYRPIADVLDVFADNIPGATVKHVRITVHHG